MLAVVVAVVAAADDDDDDIDYDDAVVVGAVHAAHVDCTVRVLALQIQSKRMALVIDCVSMMSETH